MSADRYFKWPTSSGEAFAKVPEDYTYPNIIGRTKTHLVVVALDDPGLIEISESEWREKWSGLFGQ